MWQATSDNNEPELRRLIGLGWNVNWRNPYVRRRMRIAWAPVSFCLYMLEADDTATFPHSPASRVGGRAAGTPSFAYAPSTVLLGAPTPRELLLKSSSLFRCIAPDGRTDSADGGSVLRVRRMCPAPPRGPGERQRHRGKPRALPEALATWEPSGLLSPATFLLGQRMGSYSLGGMRRPPRDRQASPPRRRRPVAPSQGRQDGPRHRAVEGQERDRRPAAVACGVDRR